jgi:hypothetical protein
MSTNKNMSAKRLLASLSPAVLDKLAELIALRLEGKNLMAKPSKQVVAGSNPVSRSYHFSIKIIISHFLDCFSCFSSV